MVQAANGARPHGEFVLTHKPDPRPEWNPALYDFTPADQFDVGGKYVTERTTRDGIGAPIVAVEREPKQGRARAFRAIANFLQRHRRRALRGPAVRPLVRGSARKETVTFNGRTVPLAADFTVPLAVMLQQTDPKKHEIVACCLIRRNSRTPPRSSGSSPTIRTRPSCWSSTA